MKSRATRRFGSAFERLPAPVRRRAQAAYGLFRQEPPHPCLRLRQVHPTRPIDSVRIGLGYRALGVRDRDEIIWFWIGSHADHDHLLTGPSRPDLSSRVVERLGRAAYGAAQQAGAEKIYHLGDLGGYSPCVNGVVDFLIEHHSEGVQGNYDETVGNDREHCGCKYEDPIQEEMATKSFEWTKQHACKSTELYLGRLPFSISFLVEEKKVLLFHATPSKNNLYWFEDRPEKFFREMAGKTDADILIYGHTHKPYRKVLREQDILNAGSVGKQKDGDPRACVTLIDITPDNVKVEFLRVPYDVEKAAQAIMTSGLPPYFAEKLKEAK